MQNPFYRLLANGPDSGSMNAILIFSAKGCARANDQKKAETARTSEFFISSSQGRPGAFCVLELPGTLKETLHNAVYVKRLYSKCRRYRSSCHILRDSTCL